MNREILFRGFYEDENGKEKAFYGGEWHVGEWVYGTPQTNARGQTFICADMTNGWNIEEPSTIGQFTCVFDKNGKRVFEGDKISICGVIAEVVFWMGIFAWKEADGKIHDFIGMYCEVIGTIYDKEVTN